MSIWWMIPKIELFYAFEKDNPTKRFKTFLQINSYQLSQGNLISNLNV